METEEVSELRKPAADNKRELARGPAEEEEEARLLLEYFREIKQRNLFQCLGLDSRLYELTPADDELRLFGFMLSSPFG